MHPILLQLGLTSVISEDFKHVGDFLILLCIGDTFDFTSSFFGLNGRSKALIYLFLVHDVLGVDEFYLTGVGDLEAFSIKSFATFFDYSIIFRKLFYIFYVL